MNKVWATFEQWQKTTELKHTIIFSVDCQWSSWTTDGSCSKSCGSGVQKSTRHKTVSESNGGSCSGSSEKYEPCNDKDCPPGKILHEVVQNFDALKVNWFEHEGQYFYYFLIF